MLQTAKHTEQSCRPVREVLNLVGDKWSILIVTILSEGVKRFSEVQHSIEGISQRMLTRTLRQLERNGLVTRDVQPTVPPSVYYALTPLGQTVMEPVKAMADWARQNYPQILDAQQEYDSRNSDTLA
jgi:DNA-binding HxlR family transcriptional regulator